MTSTDRAAEEILRAMEGPVGTDPNNITQRMNAAQYEAALAAAKTTELEEAVKGVIAAAKALVVRRHIRPETSSTIMLERRAMDALESALARLSALTKKEW